MCHRFERRRERSNLLNGFGRLANSSAESGAPDRIATAKRTIGVSLLQ